MNRRLNSSFWLYAAALSLATACGGGGTDGGTTAPPPAASVAGVTVSLSSTTLVPGGSATATASLVDASGRPLSGRSITWLSSASSIAGVDASGVITAVSPGSVTITATSEGRSGSAAIVVNPPPVATVTVALSQATVTAGGTVTALTTTRDASNAVLTGRGVAYTSSAANVATISQDGVVTAIAAGVTTISATSEGRVGSATLTVTARPVASVVVTLSNATIGIGQGTIASAVLRDAINTVLTDRGVSWTSSVPGVATVSSTGAVLALAPGTTLITASSEGRTGSALLTVSSPVASVVISGDFRVKVGDSYSYTATARTSDGSVVVRPVSWSIGEPGRGTMSGSGQYTPSLAGAATIQVRIDGVVWEITANAYDWQNLSGSGSDFISLPADNTITNKFGRSEYPEIVFVCSSTGNFFGWVSTKNFVTQNGLVGYSFDGGTITTQFWTESDDFGTLFKPGNNLVVKTFALQVAAARFFAFGFTEFQASAKAMTFRVTGLSARLSPLFNKCPGNNVIAGITATRDDGDPVALYNALRNRPAPSDVLAAQRALRTAKGTLPSAAPSVQPARLVAPDQREARRRQ